MHLFTLQEACTVTEKNMTQPFRGFHLPLHQLTAPGSPESTQCGEPMDCDDHHSPAEDDSVYPPENANPITPSPRTAASSPVSTPRGGFYTPMGSPRTPRPDTSLKTPVGPSSRISPRSTGRSPTSRVMMSPMKLVGAASPCSVRLLGHSKLVGGVVVPVLPGTFIKNEEMLSSLGTPKHRKLSFGNITKPRAKSASPVGKVKFKPFQISRCIAVQYRIQEGDTKLDTHLIYYFFTYLQTKVWPANAHTQLRELSFADLLLQDPPPVPNDSNSPSTATGLLPSAYGIIDGQQPISRSVPVTPRDVLEANATAAAAALKLQIAAGADLAGPDGCASPRKRARKSSAPERATCDFDSPPNANQEGGVGASSKAGGRRGGRAAGKHQQGAKDLQATLRRVNSWGRMGTNDTSAPSPASCSELGPHDDRFACSMPGSPQRKKLF